MKKLFLSLLALTSVNAFAMDWTCGVNASNIWNAGYYDASRNGSMNVETISIPRGDLRRFAIIGDRGVTQIVKVEVYVATKNKEPFHRWIDWTQYFYNRDLYPGEEAASPCVAAKYYFSQIRITTIDGQRRRWDNDRDDWRRRRGGGSSYQVDLGFSQ